MNYSTRKTIAFIRSKARILRNAGLPFSFVTAHMKHGDDCGYFLHFWTTRPKYGCLGWYSPDGPFSGCRAEVFFGIPVTRPDLVDDARCFLEYESPSVIPDNLTTAGTMRFFSELFSKAGVHHSYVSFDNTPDEGPVVSLWAERPVFDTGGQRWRTDREIRDIRARIMIPVSAGFPAGEKCSAELLCTLY